MSLLSTDWYIEFDDKSRLNTRCKHGFGSCLKCGTSETRDIVHTANTPNKREARRLRKKKR